MAGLIVATLALLQLLGLGQTTIAKNLVKRAGRGQQQLVIDSYRPEATPVGHLDQLNLTASSVIAIDGATGQVLYAKDPDHPQAIASITKIFTVLVIVKDHDLNQIVTVPVGLPAYDNGAVTLGLAAGERFKLVDLIKAALIPSANDAADSLAIWDSGAIGDFTTKMNQLAKVWGINDAHLASASGLDDAGNQASARALATAGRLLLTNPTINTITSTSQTQINDLSGRTFTLNSTNELLKEPGFSGIKTGYTATAGQCLLARVNIKGHNVITVVLGSQDRFGETKALAQALSGAYQWH